MTIEQGLHLIPFRTQKLRPASPMVLHARVWKSRTSPVFPSRVRLIPYTALFFYINFVIFKVSLLVKVFTLTSSFTFKPHQNLASFFRSLKLCSASWLQSWLRRKSSNLIKISHEYHHSIPQITPHNAIHGEAASLILLTLQCPHQAKLLCVLRAFVPFVFKISSHTLPSRNFA